MSRTIIFLALILFLCSFYPLTSGRSKRARTINRLENWKETGRVNEGSMAQSDQLTASSKPTVKVTFALKQRNLDILEETFHAVSNPDSERYADYYTIEQLKELVGTPEAEIQPFFKWIKTKVEGTFKTNIPDTSDFLTVLLTPSQAYQLFGSDVITLQNQITGYTYDYVQHSEKIGHFDGLLPQHIFTKIDYLTFPPVFRREKISGDASNRGTPYSSSYPYGSSPSSPYGYSSSSSSPSGFYPFPSSGNTQNLFIPFGLDSSIQILFPLVCSNGVAAQKPTSPYCPTDPLSTVKTRYFVYNISTFNSSGSAAPSGTKSYQGYPSSGFNCSLEAIESQQQVLCQFSIPNIANYVPSRVFSATLTFKSGKTITLQNELGASSFVVAAPVITPSFFKNFYGIPASTVANSPKNGAGVIQLDSTQTYIATDLEKFLQLYNIAGGTPNITVIGTNLVSQYTGTESALDIQTLLGITGTDLSAVFGQLLKGPNDNASFLALLTEFATKFLANKNSAKVYSISYGGPESLSLTKAQATRINTEFTKAGTLGISIIVASGDSGALLDPSEIRSCATSVGNCTPNCKRYYANFPATLPTVTAVGATQISTVYNKACAAKKPNGCTSNPGEIVCTSAYGSLISSGGGFSEFFTVPSWQKTQVTKYLKYCNNTIGIPTSLYNPKGRGVPDVALIGHNYPTFSGGFLEWVDGTSASAPAFAGIITLVNDRRIKAGKKALGFLNPILYKLATSTPAAFKDVTVGTNNCFQAEESSNPCCKYGFDATTGWDASTGLGSINFPTFLNALLAQA